MVDWVSLSIPVAYSAILIGSLAAFSWAYRRRQAVHAASLEPWFGQHLQRDIYYTLWNQVEGGSEGGEKGSVKVPESVLKAALMRRAAEDVARIIQMRASKQALTQLLARGSVGDDLVQRYQRAEKEIEAEVTDVVSEANALAPGWGQVIFQSANEMAANARLRKRLDEIQAMKGPERVWWDQKQATTREAFLKELDAEEPSVGSPKNAGTGAAAAAAAATATGTLAVHPDSRRGSQAPSSAGSHDDDAVIVEPNSGLGDGIARPDTPSTEGGGKKKKGKGKK